jgi:hypothetical protein
MCSFTLLYGLLLRMLVYGREIFQIYGLQGFEERNYAVRTDSRAPLALTPYANKAGTAGQRNFAPSWCRFDFARITERVSVPCSESFSSNGISGTPSGLPIHCPSRVILATVALRASVRTKYLCKRYELQHDPCGHAMELPRTKRGYVIARRHLELA